MLTYFFYYHYFEQAADTYAVFAPACVIDPMLQLEQLQEVFAKQHHHHHNLRKWLSPSAEQPNQQITYPQVHDPREQSLDAGSPGAARAISNHNASGIRAADLAQKDPPTVEDELHVSSSDDAAQGTSTTSLIGEE